MTTILTKACLLAGVAIFAVGCTADRFVYESPAHQPTTLSVVNATNDDPIWEMDIPVGTKLVVEFNVSENHNDDAFFVMQPGYAKRMNWWLYEITAPRTFNVGGYYDGKPIDQGEIHFDTNVPPRQVVSYRMDEGWFEVLDDPTGDTAESFSGDPADVAETD